MNGFEGEVGKLRSKIAKAYEEAREELEELEDAVKRWGGPIRWRGPFGLKRLCHKLEDVVEGFEEDLLEVKKRAEDLRKEAEIRGDEALKKALEDLDKLMEEELEEFSKIYEETIKRIEEYIPAHRCGKARSLAILTLPHKLTRLVTKEVGEAVKEAFEEVKKATETISPVISSIRLREEDVKIIDELVDAGTFKSRSEAVAFFVRRGIEASKEWLDKVKENIKRIRELQEEVRKELEGG